MYGQKVCLTRNMKRKSLLIDLFALSNWGPNFSILTNTFLKLIHLSDYKNLITEFMLFINIPSKSSLILKFSI